MDKTVLITSTADAGGNNKVVGIPCSGGGCDCIGLAPHPCACGGGNSSDCFFFFFFFFLVGLAGRGSRCAGT